MTLVRNIIQFLHSLIKRLSHATGAVREKGAQSDAPEWDFVRLVMREHYFTPAAQRWLMETINLRVDDLSSTGGGGYWAQASREVRLFSAQHEAAVHELAHAWWHYRREVHKDEMIEATVRLSAEHDQHYAELARLAFGYVHGIPEQPWEGLLVTRNDWEMFAGIASGTMGDMSKLPPYVRDLYKDLFEMPV